MLAMQMKHLVDEGTIERHSLIRITDYAVNHVQSRKVLIILGLEKYADPTTERLGNPQNVEAAAGATTNGAAPAAPAAAATAGAGAGAGARAGATSNYKSESSARDVKPQYNKTSNASLSNSGAGGGAGPKSKLPIYPIEGLSPYQNKWTIRARVTSKGDVKHWSKPTSSGKLFSVNFLDESSEIRATGFGDEVDKFYNLLQEGKVYYISKAKVVIAKKQFSNLSNEYELQFKSDTEIEEVSPRSLSCDARFGLAEHDLLPVHRHVQCASSAVQLCAPQRTRCSRARPDL
jgi:replication factor A1